MKKIIQTIIGYLKCSLNRVHCCGNCYVGFNVKIINHGNIQLENNVIIRPGTHVYVDKNSSLVIGENAEIGRNSTIASSSIIVIGTGVLTGPNVFISDHNHQYINPSVHIYRQGVSMVQQASVQIGDGSWLGTNVVIVGSIKVGKQCVIGANSVVTRDIPDYSVAVGIPAKIIKKYNFENKCWERI